MTATKFLIGITSVLSLYALRRVSILRKFSLVPYKVFRQNEVYRMFSSSLVYSDFMHLLLNMVGFYMVGEFVEGICVYHFHALGRAVFILLYIVGSLFSQLPILWLNRKNPYHLGMGAGGGISAILATAILLAPNALVCSFSTVCLPCYMLGVIYLSFLCYLSLRPRVYLNYFSYLTGAIFALLFNLLFIPELRDRLYHMVQYWIASF